MRVDHPLEAGSRPPRLPERLLRWAAHETVAVEPVLGDLHEEFDAVRARLGSVRARVWYWTSAVPLAVTLLGTRQGLQRARRRRLVGASPRGAHGMDGLLLDVRLAVRTLAKVPTLVAVAALTLALGIGANAAVFSVIDALALRPFPLPDIERLVMVREAVPAQGPGTVGAAPANFLDWQRQTETLSPLVAAESWDATLSGLEQPRRVHGTLVSPAFLRALGVQVTLGRDFLDDEDSPARPRTVILSYPFWSREYGEDRSVLGRTIQLDGEAYTIVGVGPRAFSFPQGTDVWAPLVLGSWATRRDAHYLTVVGRLREGLSVLDAQNELSVIAQRLASEHPSTNDGYVAIVDPLATAVMDEGSGPFLALWQGAAVFVLLIACANLANLLLVRGVARRKELALRLALGAARWRVVRQLFAESLVLASTGALLALPVAWLGVRELRRSLPPELRRFVMGWDAIDLDWRVLGFTAVVALLSSLMFGILPALRASRTALIDALRDGGRTAGSQGAGGRGRRLVVAQVALALALMAAAGLSVQGAVGLITGDRGYRADGVVTFMITLPDRQYGTPESRRAFHEEVVARLGALAGVESAAAINALPAGGFGVGRALVFDDRPSDRPSDRPIAQIRVVTPGYLATMGIPLLAGRDILPTDVEGTQRVAVVSRGMADRFWPGRDPIGRRFKTDRTDESEWITVVGVTGDVLHHWFDRERPPTFYQAFAQAPRGEMGYALRISRGDPRAILPSTRAAVAAVASDQAIDLPKTMHELETLNTIGLRFIAAIMSLFAVIALGLAALGIYGVMTSAVAQRTQEIGVRMALGAERLDVLRLTLGQAFRLTTAGLLIGLVLAVIVGKVLAGGLHGVVTFDARTVLVVAAVLLGVSLAAGYAPARTASRVDPLTALRND